MAEGGAAHPGAKGGLHWSACQPSSAPPHTTQSEGPDLTLSRDHGAEPTFPAASSSSLYPLGAPSLEAEGWGLRPSLRLSPADNSLHTPSLTVNLPPTPGTQQGGLPPVRAPPLCPLPRRDRSRPLDPTSQQQVHLFLSSPLRRWVVPPYQHTEGLPWGSGRWVGAGQVGLGSKCLHVSSDSAFPQPGGCAASTLV